MRADQDAAEQEDDDLRNARAWQGGDDERRERGDQPHGYEIVKSLRKVHIPTVGATARRRLTQ